MDASPDLEKGGLAASSPRTDSSTLNGQGSDDASTVVASNVSEPKGLPLSRLWKSKAPFDDKIDGTECRTLENTPQGYPRLAAFLSSDPNFLTFRGFSWLHTYLILHKQDELAGLENELEELDEKHDSFAHGLRNRDRGRDMQFSDSESRPRSEILDDIHKSLLEYHELLGKARELVSYQKPSSRDYRSVRRWIGYKNPIAREQAAFIRHREDVITLRQGRECAGFDVLIESCLQKIDCKLIRRLFRTKDLERKTTDPHISYYSPERIDKLVVVIITAIIFVLLVIPVVAMYQLTSRAKDPRSVFHSIGVLIVFTLLFCAAMSLLTRARRHEIFAASAAYCAILVVFLTNIGVYTR